jgi:hypothetical protein
MCARYSEAWSAADLHHMNIELTNAFAQQVSKYAFKYV